MEFKLDNKNLLLRSVYEKYDNYEVKEVENGNKCYIFFSSNGIYYPNDEKEFKKTILQKNRYEWKHIADLPEIKENAARIIFVRDIYKQYYVNGISNKVDSITSLERKLRELTKGLDIITVGTSSGGYMAVIMGIKLKAEKIFSFGGQWSLYEQLEKADDGSYYFLKMNKNNYTYNQFYDITWLLKDNTTPIYYFYSALESGDVKQADILKNSGGGSARTFAMKSQYHGYVLFHNCFAKLLTMELDKLDKIFYKYSGKIISMRRICFDLLSIKEAFKEIMRDIVNCHKILQIIFRRT